MPRSIAQEAACLEAADARQIGPARLFELRQDGAYDACGDPELVRVIVAAITLVDMDAARLDADELSHLGEHGAERVWPSKGLPCSALACSTNWPPLGWVTGVATLTLQPNS
jgi:hypothetical protein